jgi:hypothetical protein
MSVADEAAAELGALLQDTSRSLSQNPGYPVDLDFHLTRHLAASRDNATRVLEAAANG